MTGKPTSYSIRAKRFGWDKGVAPNGGGGGAQALPVTINVGGREYMLDDITAMAGGSDYRVQASGMEPYDSALFVDDVYQTDGTGSGFIAKGSKGVTPGVHHVVIGVEPGSGAGLTGNVIGDGDITLDFGLVTFPPLVP